MNRQVVLPVQAADGHTFSLIGRPPADADTTVLWLPALGVSARHYTPLADALATQGVATFIHEWRGHGSSSVRASYQHNWGYRELLKYDIPASLDALRAHGRKERPILGGHSLGGQLSCCYAGLHPDALSALWLVASGSPWWRAFPAPRRYLLPPAYRFLPWLARRHGALPGRAVGFGGKEARGLINDWARVGLSNRFAAADLDEDLETRMREVHLPVRAVVLTDDWLAPASSMQALLDKLGHPHSPPVEVDRPTLGVAADHFAWMRQPQAIVDLLHRKK